MRTSSAVLAMIVSLNASALALAPEPEWRTYSNAAGTSVAVPAGILTSTIGHLEDGTGDKFSSADGRVMLSIYVLSANGQTPESYLRTHMTDSQAWHSYFLVASAAPRQHTPLRGPPWVNLPARLRFDRLADAIVRAELSP